MKMILEILDDGVILFRVMFTSKFSLFFLLFLFFWGLWNVAELANVFHEFYIT